MKLLVTGGSGFIGTNLIEHFLNKNIDLINADIKPPLINSQIGLWQRCDIKDKPVIQDVFDTFSPTHVLHLAAKTDTDSENIDDYIDNTLGTENVLQCVIDTGTIERAVITSSQFVCGPARQPENDEDFFPHTVYGETKVINEQQTRQKDLNCIWTIIRPTNIWGPWHPRYPREFWRILRKGLYFHPGKDPVIRSYGYVKNVVHQIDQILTAPEKTVHQKVFYVGDEPVNLWDWANGFSLAITGKNARVVPRALVRAMGLIGDSFAAMGLKFPITSSRYRSMTMNYPTPMDKTFNVFGTPPHNLQDGISETVQWLNGQGFWKNTHGQ